VLLIGGTSLPLYPIVGFHLNQARRQFRAGHTLADLRTALEIARRERAEVEAVSSKDEDPRGHRLLRIVTVASATTLGITFGLVAPGVIPDGFLIPPILTTMLFGAISNALDIPFSPRRLRSWWQTGIRDRLWNSAAGEWFARRLGAPERSSAVDGGLFRPTETALGVAASELFAALPESYREQFGELPAIVAALEARAAEARAEIDVVAALAPADPGESEALERRRNAASGHLGASVAALEKIRLDLLRLHGGAGDLAPLTTLIEEARRIGEDVQRLADAEREVDQAIGWRPTGG
jgi:serine/threonine-protein kinase